MATSRNDRDGFVLFSVIWIAGLLAVIATTFAISIRLHIKSQANLAQSYQAEVAADGIAKLIAYSLAQTRLVDNASFSLPVDGSLISCALADKAQADIALQDQGGLIDLNQTSPAVLAMILNQLGVPQAELIAEALVDFRDQDQTAFEGGGEEVSLVTGGPGLKNAAFQSVDEIAQAIPESMANLSALSSLFTVYSLQEGVDPSVAPQRLKALIGTSGSSAGGGGSIPTAFSPRTAFAIDIQVELATGVTFRRIAIVALLRLPDRPFAILEWRQGESARDEKDATPLNLPCESLGGS
jgi:type II secretory pathway component PulK